MSGGDTVRGTRSAADRVTRFIPGARRAVSGVLAGSVQDVPPRQALEVRTYTSAVHDHDGGVGEGVAATYDDLTALPDVSPQTA